MNGTGIQVGELIAERYRVEGVISQGGMGVVLAARHTLMDEQVALKVLRPELTAAPDAIRRFLQEGKAAARIRSEHAVRVLDVGILGSGLPFLVMERLEGQDLAAILQHEGPLAVSRAVGYVLQACEALAEAHKLGIVHRDLKPSNLFLARMPGRPELVKVLDFGISKIPLGDDATGTLQTMGTPRYMSPEQMRTTRDVDPRSDLWSLGVILYELLSGASPFEAETVPLLYSKVLSDPPRELRTVAPHLPLGLSLVVMKCLEKDPEYRFSRIDALVEALAPFAQAQGQISRPRIALVFNDAEHPSPSLSEEMLQRATQPTLSADDLPSPMAATQSRTTPSAAVLPPAPPASTSPASTSPEAPVPAGASRPSPLRWALPLAAGAALLALLALRRDEPSPPASLAPPPSMSSSPATTVMPPVEPLPAASPREPGAPSAAPPLSSERPVAAKKQAPTTMSARPSPPPPRPAPPGADLYGARH